MGVVPRYQITVNYLTILRYSPRGNKEIDDKSRRIKDSIKGWTLRNFQQAIGEIIAQNSIIENFLQGATLVPIPGSTLVKSPETLRVPLEICNEMVNVNKSLQICDCLIRHTPIRKSHLLYNAQTRPTVQEHLNTIKLNDQIVYTDTIILVDDVLTMGATALACSKILQERYPTKIIKIFALLRPWETLGDATSCRHIERGYCALLHNGRTFCQTT